MAFFLLTPALYILLTAIHFNLAAAAAVSVLFPLDDQLPTVARIGQPYSWSFSPATFDAGSAGPLQYTAHSLPAWMSFDPSSRSIRGTPGAADEGNPKVRIEAQDKKGNTASSAFTICVTPYGPPTLNSPIKSQFRVDNPSLSSVFILPPSSPLVPSPDTPTLRVPSQWSFSIGFEGETFTGKPDIFYDARQADGSQLPDWMQFNANDITLGGVTPHADVLATPATFNLALHASDQVGYSAATLPFALVVASHELSLGTAGLPTINVTTDDHFDVPLLSPVDFEGVLVDGQQVSPSDIVSFSVDTSKASDVSYDSVSRRLTGDAPKDPLELPVSLSTSFNQSLQTNIRVVSVPSVFTQSSFDAILAKSSDPVNFDLLHELTDDGASDDVSITVAFEPQEAGAWLVFENKTRVLTGTVPNGDLGYTHVSVTFTAYSNETHSTSHAQLPIALTQTDYQNSENSKGAHAGVRIARGKLVTILSIVFGVLGGLFGLGLLIAALTKCARMKDTALPMEEAARSYTASEKRYYGVGDDVEKGYSFADQGLSQRGSDMSLDNIYVPGSSNYTQPSKPHGARGLGLHRALTRTPPSATASPTHSGSGQISKGLWMDKIRSGMRTVSDITRKGSVNKRPVISRPTLVAPPVDSSPTRTTPSLAPLSGLLQPPLFSNTIRQDSLGDSFYHIQQRGEFGGSDSAARIRDSHVRHVRADSDGSVSSLASDASERTHEAQAVVQQASRTSLRRYQVPLAGDGNARVVPFTSSGRTVVPHSPTVEAARSGRVGTRVQSQIAVFQGGEPDDFLDSARYVATLGEDGSDSQRLHPAPSRTPTTPRTPGTPRRKPVRAPTRTSMQTEYTLNSDERSVGDRDPPQSSILAALASPSSSPIQLATVGDGCLVRIRLTDAGAAAQRRGTLYTRQLDGSELPTFLHAELHEGASGPGVVYFRGTPGPDDEGIVQIVVCDEGGNRVGHSGLEVIARRDA